MEIVASICMKIQPIQILVRGETDTGHQVHKITTKDIAAANMCMDFVKIKTMIHNLAFDKVVEN